ncbi:MAG: hypothetical protein ACREQ5_01615, partial [Candidatus Dormibacteria bacterium]
MGQIQGAARREEGYLFGKHHPELEWAWIILVWVGRGLSGRAMGGDARRKTDATFFKRGTRPLNKNARPPSFWSYMAEGQRALIRILILTALISGVWGYFTHPTGLKVTGYSTAAVLAIGGLIKAYRHWKDRRFHRIYRNPLAKAARDILNIPPSYATRKWIEFTPGMKAHLPHIQARTMGKREKAARLWYGTHIAPVLMFLPERTMRGWWWFTGHLPTVTRAWKYGRTLTATIRLRCPSGYIDEAARKLLRAVVMEKVGLRDLVENWSMVGPDAITTYTIRDRPPLSAILADIAAAVDACDEWELVAGLGPKRKPVVVSLPDGSPHICASAASGAGKTILAMVFAVQVLRKGGRVYILDTNGCHRWARGLNGVTYCRTVASIHDALIGLDSLAQARIDQAAEEDEGWNPGERVFVIFEEMNATVAKLKAYWEKLRGKGDPKLSPAIQAFRNISQMGRAAKVNLFAVAQMLTVNTTGGTEARENFGIRCLARYTSNAWKMLASEVAMPRKSMIRGRWQCVFGGTAYEIQVPFDAMPDGRTLNRAIIKEFAQPRYINPATDVRTEPPAVGEPVRYTLAAASREEWCELSDGALRKRKGKAGDTWPAGIDGKYTRDEILSAIYLQGGEVFGTSASSAFYRRDALLEVGAFPEEFAAYFEDVDLSFRLHWSGYRIVYEPASVVWHRVSASHGRPSRRLLEQQ